MAIHRFGEFELDNTLYELRRDEQILEIGPRVFDVLAYLIDHRDRLVSKDELIQRVWGATAMSSSSVPTCIAFIIFIHTLIYCIIDFQYLFIQ